MNSDQHAGQAPTTDPLSVGDADVQAGESAARLGYPALALDPQQQGFWGTVDRLTERVTAILNPILVKEARQSLKSRQFLIAFFCLLAASCGWTILGVVFQSPEVYYLPRGDDMLGGYFVILSISLLLFVPLVAFRSLAAELDEGTYEMLAITRLTAWRIVTGKLNSAILQMLIYFSAIVPCLAFCYLLRGIGLSTILLLVGLLFVIALVLTSLALLLSTLASGRSLQTFLLVLLFAGIVIVEFMLTGFTFSLIIREQWEFGFAGLASAATMAASFVLLFLAAAAARIGPVTENRSTRLRAILFAQQVLWIVTAAYAARETAEVTWLNLGMLYLCAFWFVVGTFVCGERWELSPRVRRGLPSNFASRMLLTWWMPGPGTGFMFVVSTATAGMLVLGGLCPLLIWAGTSYSGSSSATPPLICAAVMTGYLVGYLGLIRLASLPIMRRFGPSFAVPLGTAVVLSFLGVVLPATIDVLSDQRMADDYTVLHASNWIWTLGETFSTGGVDEEIGVLIFLSGGLILAINLILLFREFRLRRSAVPQRVIQESAVREERSP